MSQLKHLIEQYESLQPELKAAMDASDAAAHHASAMQYKNGDILRAMEKEFASLPPHAVVVLGDNAYRYEPPNPLQLTAGRIHVAKVIEY